MTTPKKSVVDLVVGTATVVVCVPTWNQERAALTPTIDVQRAYAKLLRLADHSLEAFGRMNFLTFPMKGRNGFFEVRQNGVRFYGARHCRVGPTDLVVMLGVEQKAGRTNASKAVLDQSEARLLEFKAALDVRAKDIKASPREKT
jgi:hypothetical protein